MATILGIRSRWIAIAAVSLAVVAAAAYPFWHAHMAASRTEQHTRFRPHLLPGEVNAPILARLHQEYVSKFVSADDFGFSRTIRISPEWKSPWWSPGELDQDTTVAQRSDLDLIYQSSLNLYGDGSNPNGFTGPVKSPDRRWEIKSISLIGLLKKEEPVVYLTEELPDMKKLGNVPTRTPDLFEVAALEKLQKGEDLFARSKDEVVRMVGALRAGAKCLECHEAREGDLLGAFTYTLRIDPFSKKD